MVVRRIQKDDQTNDENKNTARQTSEPHWHLMHLFRCDLLKKKSCGFITAFVRSVCPCVGCICLDIWSRSDVAWQYVPSALINSDRTRTCLPRWIERRQAKEFDGKIDETIHSRAHQENDGPCVVARWTQSIRLQLDCYKRERRRNSTLPLLLLLRRRWELRPFNEITPIPCVDLLRKVTLELRVCIR